MTNNPHSLALLDSNILVYAEQEDASQHRAAKSLRDQALTGAVSACVCPQVLNEFFVGVTRTDKRAVQRPISAEQYRSQFPELDNRHDRIPQEAKSCG